MSPSPPRILLVSDRPVRHSVSEFLQREGYETLLADPASVPEAEIRNGGPDLILLDHLCDEFNSFALYRALRRLHPDRLALIVAFHSPPDYFSLKEAMEWVFQEATESPRQTRRHRSKAAAAHPAREKPLKIPATPING